MKKFTFTKKIITIILIVALIDLQFPFILAFFGMDNIAEELGKVLVVEVIGVTLVYCCKSYFETKEEKNNEMEILRMGDLTGFDDAEVVDKEVEDVQVDK